MSAAFTETNAPAEAEALEMTHKTNRRVATDGCCCNHLGALETEHGRLPACAVELAHRERLPAAELLEALAFVAEVRRDSGYRRSLGEFICDGAALLGHALMRGRIERAREAWRAAVAAKRVA